MSHSSDSDIAVETSFYGSCSTRTEALTRLNKQADLATTKTDRQVHDGPMTPKFCHMNFTFRRLPKIAFGSLFYTIKFMILHIFRSQKRRARHPSVTPGCSLIATALFAIFHSTHASPILELRGILQTDSNGWMFSIHQPQTGTATWLRMHQTRNGYFVDHYDETTQTATVQNGEEQIEITLVQADDFAFPIQFSVNQLSAHNRNLYEQHKHLIIQSSPTHSSNAAKKEQINRLRKITRLRNFLMSNPSLNAVNEHLGELGESVDYAALMKIPVIPGVESRNAQNTAGWGIKKNVDLKQLEESLRSNPSIEAINELVAAK